MFSLYFDINKGISVYLTIYFCDSDTNTAAEWNTARCYCGTLMKDHPWAPNWQCEPPSILSSETDDCNM